MKGRKGQKIKEKKRMHYRHELQLKANLKNVVSIAPEANSELVTFLKVQCESCGTPTDAVRVSPADEYVYEQEILNVVCPCKDGCKVGKLKVESIGLCIEDGKKTVFAEIDSEGLFPVNDGLEFGFRWVVVNEMGVKSDPFMLFSCETTLTYTFLHTLITLTYVSVLVDQEGQQVTLKFSEFEILTFL